jgi:hypothetical protein
MSGNGRLTASELAPIPGGRLAKTAAPSWNALYAICRMKGVPIYPSGSRSSYRPYADQQYFWSLYRSGRGNLAAYPGTSNHGLGLAVDLATPQMRTMIDRYGAPFGWAKKWSDAPGEWWHIKWRGGVWKGKASDPVLRRGSSGHSVATLQKLLRAKNVKRAPKPSGYLNLATSRAVKRFQKKHSLKADGVVGAKTWKKLRS